MESKITLSLEEWEEYKNIKDNYNKEMILILLLGILPGGVIMYLILNAFMICG